MDVVKVVLLLVALGLLVAGVAVMASTFAPLGDFGDEVSGAMRQAPDGIANSTRRELSGAGFAALALSSLLGGERWTLIAGVIGGGIVTVVLFTLSFGLYRKVTGG